MDGIIQMLPPCLRQFSTHIDFEGQHKAERIFQMILIVHGIVGLVIGFATQQLSNCMYCVFLGFIISCLLVLPPWPMYRRNPLTWQPDVDHDEHEDDEGGKNKSAPAPSGSSGKGEGKKRR